MSKQLQSHLRKIDGKANSLIYNVKTEIYSSFYSTYLFIKCYHNINPLWRYFYLLCIYIYFFFLNSIIYQRENY